MEYKVCKFGGTSMACANQIKKAVSIMLEDNKRRIMVVSAPGKRFDTDTKVTDLLIELYKKIENNDSNYILVFDEIINRYLDIIKGLDLNYSLIDIVKNDLKKRTEIKDKTILLESLKAFGEDQCAKIVATYLNNFVKSKYISPLEAKLYLSDEPSNARVLKESYDYLYKLRDYEEVIVFPGFFGYTLNNNIVTFARGGADITGSILAAGTKATMYENFTDVDNVFVANPKLIDSPESIYKITYREMRELTYAGFSVLHEEALEPIVRNQIPINIKNTNNPNARGTLICSRYQKRSNYLAGITGKKGFTSIYINKYLMNREIGFLRQLLQILENEKISFDHTPTGIDNISIILETSELENKDLNKILENIKETLDVDAISVKHNIAILTIVDEKIIDKNVISIASACLANNDININLISLCTSGVSLMLGVEEEHLEKAIKLLYKEFFNK